MVVCEQRRRRHRAFRGAPREERGESVCRIARRTEFSEDRRHVARGELLPGRFSVLAVRVAFLEGVVRRPRETHRDRQAAERREGVLLARPVPEPPGRWQAPALERRGLAGGLAGGAVAMVAMPIMEDDDAGKAVAAKYADKLAAAAAAKAAEAAKPE